MRIFSNSAVSLDGKLSPSRDRQIYMGSAEDRRRMHEIRLQADAILISGLSYRLEPTPLYAKAEVLDRPVCDTPVWNVCLTRSLNWISSGMMDHPRVKPLILAPRQKMPQNFPYEVEFSAEEICPDWIVSVLRKRGISNLLIEAGGTVLLQFIAADLMSDMYITLVPKIVCDPAAPGLCDGSRASGLQMKNLKLLQSQIIGDEVFLHYAACRESP